MNMEAMIDKYFRPGRLPHIWCPGCGNGVVTGTIVKAVAKLDLDKDKVAVISGIGCSSRASGYLDFNTVHSAHGRALPVRLLVRSSIRCYPDFNLLKGRSLGFASTTTDYTPCSDSLSLRLQAS